jgi:type IV fimbrial biogenesis protein FimT
VTDRAHFPRQKFARVSFGRARGFTLVELIITLFILAIVLVVALPGFSTLTLSTRLKSYANEVVGSVYLARGEAIKRNAPMTMCITANGTSCAGSGSWAQGWIVRAADGTVIRWQQALGGGYQVTTSPTAGVHTLTFQSSGATNPSTAMTICRKTPSVGAQERVVRISAIGRSNVSTTNTASCP